MCAHPHPHQTLVLTTEVAAISSCKAKGQGHELESLRPVTQVPKAIYLVIGAPSPHHCGCAPMLHPPGGGGGESRDPTVSTGRQRKTGAVEGSGRTLKSNKVLVEWRVGFPRPLATLGTIPPVSHQDPSAAVVRYSVQGVEELEGATSQISPHNHSLQIVHC